MFENSTDQEDRPPPSSCKNSKFSGLMFWEQVSLVSFSRLLWKAHSLWLETVGPSMSWLQMNAWYIIVQMLIYCMPIGYVFTETLSVLKNVLRMKFVVSRTQWKSCCSQYRSFWCKIEGEILMFYHVHVKIS